MFSTARFWEWARHGRIFRVCFPFAVAYSLSVGFTIAEYNLLSAIVEALIISVVTFGFCLGGVFLGRKSGGKFSDKSEIVGGVILVAIGLEIFIKGLIGG